MLWGEQGVEPLLLIDGRLAPPWQRAWPDLASHPWDTDPASLDWDQHLPLGDLGPRLRPDATLAVALPGVQLVCLPYGAVNEALRAPRQETGIEVLGLAGLDLRDALIEVTGFTGAFDTSMFVTS